jgi:hypothetical protein
LNLDSSLEADQLADTEMTDVDQHIDADQHRQAEMAKPSQFGVDFNQQPIDPQATNTSSIATFHKLLHNEDSTLDLESTIETDPGFDVTSFDQHIHPNIHPNETDARPTKFRVFLEEQSISLQTSNNVNVRLLQRPLGKGLSTTNVKPMAGADALDIDMADADQAVETADESVGQKWLDNSSKQPGAPQRTTDTGRRHPLQRTRAKSDRIMNQKYDSGKHASIPDQDNSNAEALSRSRLSVICDNDPLSDITMMFTAYVAPDASMYDLRSSIEKGMLAYITKFRKKEVAALTKAKKVLVYSLEIEIACCDRKRINLGDPVHRFETVLDFFASPNQIIDGLTVHLSLEPKDAPTGTATVLNEAAYAYATQGNRALDICREWIPVRVGNWLDTELLPKNKPRIRLPSRRLTP